MHLKTMSALSGNEPFHFQPEEGQVKQFKRSNSLSKSKNAALSMSLKIVPIKASGKQQNCFNSELPEKDSEEQFTPPP